jgi:hypothetical protein
MDLNKYRRNPDENNGWHFDYKFIKEISDMTNAGTFSSGMEEVESVIKALCDREDVDKSKSNFAIPLVGVSEAEVCVNCDEMKETHNICSDCLTKIINENKQT